MLNTPQTLDWIDQQASQMLDQLIQLASINSGTYNLHGINQVADLLQTQLQSLPGNLEVMPLPPHEIIDQNGNTVQRPLGPALSLKKQPSSDHKLKIFFAIHFDTVYPENHPFQNVTQQDGKLLGPGVADAKGGLIVLLNTVQAIEHSIHAPHIGWEIFLNPDEEISSPATSHLFTQAASNYDIGMVYEPSLPNGNLISHRKGSANYTVIIKGKSAHAGRDFHKGANAINAASQLATKLHQFNENQTDFTLNVAQIHGGTALNTVPDLTTLRFNIRMSAETNLEVLENRINQSVEETNQLEGITATLHGGISAPPKLLTPQMQHMLDLAANASNDLNIKLEWNSSGGVCDGSRLAAAGLPTLDTLGVRGDHIHSSDEYMIIDSLTERTKLSFLIIEKLVTGKVPLPAALNS